MHKRKLLVVLLICILMVCVIPISYFIYLQSDRHYYNDLIKETNVKHLDYKNLDYLYVHTSGFEDKIGIYYFVFDFKEEPIEFLNQFSNSSFEGKYHFYDEPNKEFEEEILNNIQQYIGDKYNDIPDSYKLDFTNKYNFSKYPMFYFPDSKRLIIIQFILVK